MIHWLQRSPERWLSRGLAALLTSLAFEVGSSSAQMPTELPLAMPEAKVKPATSRQKNNQAPVQQVAAQEPVRAAKTKAKAVAELPAPKAKEKESANFAIHDPAVKKASCSSCGGGLLGLATGHSSGCANGQCVPGRQACTWCDYDTCWGRMVGGIYECLCCPDPCYEPRWIDTANAAFYQDSVRPITMTRLRWNAGRNYTFPDTAEMFWAKIKGGGNGKGPANFERAVSYDDFSLYQETGAGNFSFFVEMPYRALEVENNPSSSGFGDMNLGTKSLFLDCELIQMAFVFRTYLPVGSFGKGLGVGHVSLEPSLLTTVKLAPTTYLQTQLAQWIPIGGDSDHQGSALKYAFSLNHLLCGKEGHAALIGTLELNGITFQAGQFTADAAGTLQDASGKSFVSAGPGLRFALCNKYDIGFGTAFGLTDHGPEQSYRLEFRVRY